MTGFLLLCVQKAIPANCPRGGEVWDLSNQLYTAPDLDALSAAEGKLLQSLAGHCLARAIATGLSISLALNSPLQKFNF